MTDRVGTVSEDVFRALVSGGSEELLRAAGHVSRFQGSNACFTRPLLRRLLCAATETEETLDAYGASRNRRWHALRRFAAAIKLFSTVAYQIQHLLLFLPTYRLHGLDQDFHRATAEALDSICAILRGCLQALFAEAGELGLQPPAEPPPGDVFEERLPAGRLPADRPSQKVTSPERTVAAVATAFLNLAGESAFIHATQEPRPEGHSDWIPDPINEARLRELEQRFHSLQSLYDTHISDTDVESLDADLPVLRGHVTVIYHLLEMATSLTHYCERHILSFSPPVSGAAPDGGGRTPEAPVVEPPLVLRVLLGYALAFASRYIVTTRGLCHAMLGRYAIQGHISVPVPRHRGFHVRPSTMIAKIVAHYGSSVTMALEGESYNAGFTLDLFRANEKINAVKRRLLSREVEAELAANGPPEGADPEAAVRAVAQRLFARGKLVLYERSLSLQGFPLHAGESPPELVTRALTHMLAMGKIDVEMEVAASFSGDRRVLEDIRLLAGCGYGEDDFGNNLPLPPELQYLRK